MHTEEKKVNVVILAAGAGKRMHSMLPKVLHEIAGRSLLQHVVDRGRSLMPDKICIVIGHGAAQVKHSMLAEDVNWILQDQQLGTGHALLQALPQLDANGVTLVLYGDVPLISQGTLQKLMTVSAGKYCSLLTAVFDNPFGYGRIIRDFETGEVAAIVEQKDATVDQQKICEINTGIMMIPNVRLHSWLPEISNNNSQREYYLTDIIALAVRDGVEVKTIQADNYWEVLGVNSKTQLAKLERIYQENYSRELMEKGVRLMDPERIDVRGDLNCGSDVSIDINCIFEGTVTLGNSVQIGAHCVLRNVRVASGVIIQPFCMIEDAEIEEACKIGPYARIRPGTKLASQVHIGNFVEVKNSQIGPYSKANHLSYIGDSTIGQHVNIGAGTITCNYDGVNKYRTVIEDDVFIGSDTQLIAPVKIARGSTIGAGSTITKETPENQLTLSRSKQVSIANWRRPEKKK
ncbi:bifunctional UDP-N-acetylglucosamine diphosphorylase/glucosamine-1-phosphate N-acetyltransferase GlmU [Nitrosomonas sp.]|uniref:bifunctional UDP-N-acetylglucosamine diphosphorylase/glucosamine-1-phosphate N-acetyltransferase GlmU n=1 Tax=Nitrosomonas sp. TaxID=42353 RepID=UPI001D2F8818|nr:bifunctional UDP-N-acetylglucosamine diphosphorylase/glucosamine-1-phosphate N-acetyltransferase GlmU [Nitrosomonas sp.]MBX3617209.1 bifunctional UDP-N-acetylglucosamine diphosphorylase/glucosamine-1-phosphate N-acetyltransferase GlmU [Nitrosomonas sp.]